LSKALEDHQRSPVSGGFSIDIGTTEMIVVTKPTDTLHVSAG